jgi:hypothetical protein
VRTSPPAAAISPSSNRKFTAAGSWLGALDTALAHVLSVVEQRDAPALGQSAAVVCELHAHLVRSRRYGARRLGGMDLDAAHVVRELGRAVLGVQAPAAECAALSDDHAVGAALRYFDFRGDGERLVLRVFGQAPAAGFSTSKYARIRSDAPAAADTTARGDGRGHHGRPRNGRPAGAHCPGHHRGLRHRVADDTYTSDTCTPERHVSLLRLSRRPDRPRPRR